MQTLELVAQALDILSKIPRPQPDAHAEWSPYQHVLRAKSELRDAKELIEKRMAHACPDCSTNRWLTLKFAERGRHVICKNCFAEGPVRATAAEAWAAWDETRASPWQTRR